jgi:DNA-binding transcriptional LysR family regulator
VEVVCIVELRQLEMLVKVAELGSVTAAGRALHLAQPAVTRHIRLLEEELGVPLFIRTPSGMRLTGAGRSMAQSAERALNELEASRRLLRSDPGSLSGVVTVGIVESVAELVAMPLEATIRTRFPDIDLRLVLSYSIRLEEWLRGGHVDIAVLDNTETRVSNFETTPVLTEPLWAVAAPTCAVGDGAEVSWEQALHNPLVLPMPTHELRPVLDRLLDQSGIVPQVALQTTAIELQKRMAASGRAWAVLPHSAVAEDISEDRLSGAKLVAPTVDRQIGICLSSAHPRPAVNTVAGQTLQTLREFVRSGRWQATWLLGAARSESTDLAVSGGAPQGHGSTAL